MTDCDACQPAVSSELPEITNRPGLSSLQYRLRTYATFRAAMLARIPFETIGVDTPLSTWTTRQDSDFGIALIDLWAYIADVLTFYQERTANEAFLRTAILVASLRRLAAMLDYRPAPGVASVAYLAYTLQPPTPNTPQVVIPLDLRAQSVPGQNEKPQKFETEETRLTRSGWNRLLPVTRAPQQLTTTTEQIYLRGIVGTIKPGDTLLIVGDERIAVPEDNHWDFRTIEQFVPEADQTLVTLSRRLGLARRGIEPGTNPRVYVFRQRASLFGFNAPVLSTLPSIVRHQIAGHTITTISTAKKVTNADNSETTTITTTIQATDPVTHAVVPDSSLPSDWDFTTNPPGESVIDLDAAYPKILDASWLVLLHPNYTELYRVQAIATDSRTDYTMTGKVSRLTLDTTVNLPAFKRDTRSTVVFTQPEALPLGDTPVTTEIFGDTLDVVGDQTALEHGRLLLLVGLRNGEPVQEPAYLLETTLVNGNTQLRLVDPLVNRYDRETLQIYANVARATHGETVREVLGGGDAAQAFQSFRLQKAPLTFVPQAGAPNGAASTLQVRVNDLLWNEVRSFYGHDPDEAIYVTETDELGKTTIRFGDGSTGQRLPTGRSNVTAVYRQGIGVVGNVNARTITTLLDRPLGVKSVVNPIKSDGGAEAESAAAIRTNAPNTVRTFGRIISLRDFEDAAREYAGIAKARASLEWNGEDEFVHLIVAGDGGAEITPGGSKYRDLLADLNSRRDPNRNLRLDTYVQAPVVLAVNIIVDTPTFLAENVLAAVRTAITTYFAFDSLNLGQTIYLSDVYRAIQEVSGVVAVDIDRFGFVLQLPTNANARRAYLEAQAARGVTFTTSGGDPEPDPVQVLAVARANEIICLSDSDLTVTQIQEPSS